MKDFKFSHGLFLGLMLGLFSSLLINTYAQTTPSGLFIEQVPPLPGMPANRIRYHLYFETIEIRHHGETFEVDVHKLMEVLKTIK